MAISTRLRLFHLFHLSKPASDRVIYQTVFRRRDRKILEFGIGSGQRATRLIEVASQHVPLAQISYIGIDPFEARVPEDGPGLTLKEAHRLLRATGTRVRLVPGDPLAVFPTVVNELGIADLVLIDRRVDSRQLPHLTYYLERMLHDGSLVVLKGQSEGGAAAPVKILPLERIHALAASFRRAA